MSHKCDIIKRLKVKYTPLKYQLRNRKIPYDNWFNKLDETTQARVDTRLDRLSLGNFGDCKLINSGIFELRFFFGAGYRIYFAKDGNKIIILLCAGDKKTQNKDIKLAQQLHKNYLIEKRK